MLLLDTHALVWLASDIDQLPARAQQAIVDNSGSLSVSAVSALEIALLVKRDRLTLPIDPLVFVEAALHQHGINEVPVDRHVAVRSANLPDIHNDPFDRVIVATAQHLGMMVLSKDPVLCKYPDITVTW